jgi:5-methyltetrahydrofolate--homocysteine methyltransferase
MTRAEFKKMAKARLLFLDGATGSNLMKMGLPNGVCPEQWIIEHPETIITLQQDYVRAGSNIVYAPTFTGNRVKLAEYGLEAQIGEINRRLIGLSRQAVAGGALVAGDLSMTGRQVKPVGDLSTEELIDIYKEQIAFLVEAGADLLVVETMMSLAEARAALIAARETCDLPVMVSLTFEPSGRTLFGTDGATAAVVLESLGASAVGINCSVGPDKMLAIVREMAAVTDLPIMAKPNAGLPFRDEEGKTVYSMDKEAFTIHMKELVKAGASILGGCCGTDPTYIAELTAGCADLTPIKSKMTENCHLKRRLASERATVSFGLDDKFIIVGERINPTGKKKLQAQLREGCLDTVIEFAEAQEENGATILDVNMGMNGIDEQAMMLQAIDAIGMATNLPLAIDSSHIEVVEAALRRYPGRALINSISAESDKFNRLLPIAARYGAMFILLPLSDAGLPQNFAEKKLIIEKIVARALELGMKKEDIIVDALVTTVGANPMAACEALETIRYCKEKGYATICGLSNISFGLPERSFINATFLTMAIKEGLTMAIANPSQELLVCSALAADLLLGRDGADLRYIEHIGQMAPLEPVKKSSQPVADRSDKPLTDRSDQASTDKADRSSTDKADRSSAGKADRSSAGKTDQSSTNEPDKASPVVGQLVKEAVIKGNRNGILALTERALDEGMEARTLLDDFLLPAINEVGRLFDSGRYFLPQLIAGAEAMKLAIERLEPLLLQNNSGEPAATIVIATVAGDIHDIGKNLVALMLKNYGYKVIDLGKDVKRETIVEAAITHNASIIALSALMTTTMVEMKRVVELVRERNLPIRVIIGGAVITQDYADEIGADGYSRDAADSVRLVQRIIS